MDAKSLQLAQIDIAPADRAGIGDLAAIPHFTREMSDNGTIHHEENPEMDKLTVIQELTADDARLLPEPVRAAIVAAVAVPPEVATVATIRETLGLEEGADIAAVVTELQQAKAEAGQRAIADRITELLTDDETGVKQEAVRPVVRELMEARNPQTPEQADAAYQAVIEMESVKQLMQSKLTETMGPPQRKPVAGQAGNRYFKIPEAA